MSEFIKQVQVRWSDLDPNIHLRHSVYYDWGAYSRIRFFEEHQLSTSTLSGLKIGPILFREECVFRREIRMGDQVTINLQLTKCKRDYSRWAIHHTINKNGDTAAAFITVEGAWLDTVQRKLATPPVEVVQSFSQMPLHEKFEWLD